MRVIQSALFLAVTVALLMGCPAARSVGGGTGMVARLMGLA